MPNKRRKLLSTKKKVAIAEAKVNAIDREMQEEGEMPVIIRDIPGIPQLPADKRTEDWVRGNHKGNPSQGK